MVGTTSWTDEQVKILEQMLRDGASASMVSRRIGKTRSAVIGKASREGIPFGRSPIAATKQTGQTERINRKRRQQAADARRRPSNRPHAPLPATAPIPVPRMDDRHADNIDHILKLEDHHCRWPVGHPGADDFVWCGREKAAHGALPYCADHAQRAVRPIDDGSGPAPKRQHDYRRKYEGAM